MPVIPAKAGIRGCEGPEFPASRERHGRNMPPTCGGPVRGSTRPAAPVRTMDYGNGAPGRFGRWTGGWCIHLGSDDRLREWCVSPWIACPGAAAGARLGAALSAKSGLRPGPRGSGPCTPSSATSGPGPRPPRRQQGGPSHPPSATSGPGPRRPLGGSRAGPCIPIGDNGSRPCMRRQRHKPALALPDRRQAGRLLSPISGGRESPRDGGRAGRGRG